jgi:hypothetical protein
MVRLCHSSINSTTRHAALAPGRFKNIWGKEVANQGLTNQRNGARQGELGFHPGAHFARVFTSGSYAGF